MASHAAGTTPAAAWTVVAEPDPIVALERALRGPGPGPVLVAGSLYLVGAARGHLVDDPDLRDPDPTQDAGSTQDRRRSDA